ncbi:hypothetical protein BG015_009294 [Linnemannia schmuckeri]|uniref:dolichol kinase n=1 Tax=Linnemannia schmuckeri TaxID=64567 RepID=A0A9P5RZ77_9FUNG|nr:hypothetical protein BG015_009294 [Linnemannia schmuckeri]
MNGSTGASSTTPRGLRAFFQLGGGSSGSRASPGGPNPAQRRRRANLLRVRIERALMVGMGLLAGYRMMTLDYSQVQGDEAAALREGKSSLSYEDRHRGGAGVRGQQSQFHHAIMPTLAKDAWALGAGFVVLVLIHALFLTAHDSRLQFPVHKNVPLQPLKKRSSRYLNMTAPQTVATAAAAAADTDEESEDDEALYRERVADLHEENLLLNQESAHGTSGTGTGAGIMDPVLGSLQSRFCRTGEGAAPQWRVWGSEAHWYRKGADNGSIFATVLVPVVLAAKFVQTVTDEKFSSTGISGIKTAETVLSSMALSLTFGASILIHMLLLKVFEEPSGPRTGKVYQQQYGRRPSSGVFKSTVLDSIVLPPPMAMTPVPASSTTISASTSTNNLSTASGSLYPKHLYPPHRTANAISSPSSPSSPSLSAASSAPSSIALTQPYRQIQQQQQQQQQHQDIQDIFMFSADQMHHPSLLMGSSEAEKTSDREEIWIIALGFGGAYTGLVTLLARFKWIPGLENTGAGMVMLNQNVFQLLMIGFAYFYRRSFTFGELTILAQVVTLLIHETLRMNFMTSPPSPPGAVLENPQFLFLLTLVVGMLLIGVLLTPVLMYCRRLAQMPTKGAKAADLQKREFKKKVAAGIVYSGLLVIVLGLIMPRCERVLGQNPFLWLIEFMLMTRIFTPKLVASLSSSRGQSSLVMDPLTKPAESGGSFFGSSFLGGSLQALMGIQIGWSRLGLCLYWIMAVGCSIGFFYWMNSTIRRRSIMGSLNNRRKYYHALAVLMFVPGYLTDEPFMHIAFSVGLASLIFLEYIRYFAVVPFGKEIHLFLVGFLDGRDGGPIILSHLYLLMGCAAPVWLAEHHILAGLSGIFALGVGDAMASIVGKRFGRHRWPGTIKTVEGTVAFVGSVMVAAGTIFVGMWLMSFVFGDSASSLLLQKASSLTAGSSGGASGPSEGGTKTSPPRALPSSLPPAALLSFSTWNDWSAVSWTLWGVIRYGIAVSVAAMLEAVSEQNDNLVIPVLMLAMVWLI